MSVNTKKSDQVLAKTYRQSFYLFTTIAT